jgi:hypothetical protein
MALRRQEARVTSEVVTVREYKFMSLCINKNDLVKDGKV